MTENRDELLPCPFCGGAAYVVRYGSRRQSCQIGCEGCGVIHESADEGGRTGQSWNRRAARSLTDGGQEQRDELWNLVDRAYKMLWLACPEVRVIHKDDHNPLVAWVSDAKVALERRQEILPRCDVHGPYNGHTCPYCFDSRNDHAAPQTPCTPHRSSPGLPARADSANGISPTEAAILDETGSGAKSAGAAPSSPEQSGAGEILSDDDLHDLTCAATREAKFDDRLKAALRITDSYEFIRSQLEAVRKERDEAVKTAIETSQMSARILLRAEAAEQRARDIREECARKVAALRADWEKRLGKGGEFWDGYTSFAKACLKAIMGV
jgi:Lar family restriction alleviation protein